MTKLTKQQPRVQKLTGKFTIKINIGDILAFLFPFYPWIGVFFRLEFTGENSIYFHQTK